MAGTFGAIIATCQHKTERYLQAPINSKSNKDVWDVLNAVTHQIQYKGEAYNNPYTHCKSAYIYFMHLYAK